MARHREDDRATGIRHAQAREPGRALAQDGGHGRIALRVVDRGGLAVQAEGGRERRLEARLALLAFERFEQRGFFTADVGTRAHGAVDVDIDAGALDVLAQQPGGVGFFQRRLEARHRFAQEFAADVVVAHGGAHGSSRRWPCPR